MRTMKIFNNVSTKTKAIVYVVIAVLVIVGAVLSIVKNNNTKNARKDLSITEVRKLGEEEKEQVLEARLKDLQGQAKSLSNAAAASDKYNVFLSLAEVQLELGKYQEAVSSLDSIPEEKKNNSRIPLNYGLAYKGLGDTGKAKEFLKTSLDMDETNALGWLAYLELSKDLPADQLKAMYAKAAKDTINNVDVVIACARYFESVGDKALAVGYWETARNVNPDGAGEYEKEIARLRQ